jgi:carbon storage regulator
MLVLTRRVGESILIGPDIEVRVLELHGRQVRIGVQAPRDVTIVRDELVRDDGPDSGALPAGPS